MANNKVATSLGSFVSERQLDARDGLGSEENTSYPTNENRLAGSMLNAQLLSLLQQVYKVGGIAI